MIQDTNHRHQYDDLMQDIPIYAGKNMDLANWLLQSEKVGLLPGCQEYKIVMAKVTGTP